MLHFCTNYATLSRRGGEECWAVRGVRLLHDNAPVHTAAVAKDAVKKCDFQEIEHPPYSPDLAPSDYYLFSKLKKDLRGRKFDDDDEVKRAVMEHFADKDPE